MKKFFLGIGVTITMWVIIRFIPSMLAKILYSNTVVPIIVSLVMIFPGFWAAYAISRGRVSGWIKGNLYVFEAIEALGLCSVLPYIMNLQYATGQFSYDQYGIAYSDYPLLIGGGLVYGIAYIASCAYLIRIVDERTEAAKKEHGAE